MGAPRWLPFALIAVLAPRAAVAATGVCDQSPANAQACIDAVQAAGAVTNDIFRDANGRTGPQLPVFGAIFNRWAGCPAELPATCGGTSLPPYDCPGAYSCATTATTAAANAVYMNALDHLWAQPLRVANPTLVGGCPDWTVIGDGVGGNYLPQFGMIFDLGGDANKVAIFAENDHGPQPCESFEYTVFLTNNPMSTEVILHPATDGVDPSKWNRAVLSRFYTWGWFNTRAPDPAGHGTTCGDTANYAVEDDSFVQVFSLPCGINFRYASIVGGNDGLDFPQCGFDSADSELDAVAGLTEAGAGICPDADRDGFADCACPGAPTVCDCNDADPAIHPGAHENCDSPDLDCDGAPGACNAGLTCYQGVCVGPCGAGEFGCPPGSTCTDTASGRLCVPDTCGAGCPPGSTCSDGQCVPSCAGVTCPAGELCTDGHCHPACEGVVCTGGRVCDGGECVVPCSCLQGDLGCAGDPGTVCSHSDGTCGYAACTGVTCTGSQHCDATGACVAQCSGVTCPALQHCVEGRGCVAWCDGITCDPGLACDPRNGDCVDAACLGVTCTAPASCRQGVCVDPTAPDAGPDAGAGADGQHGGCCQTGQDGRGALAAAALVALVIVRRRRRA